MNQQNKRVYTHDKARTLVEKFEDILSKYDICVPSPEDDERDEDNMVGLYGSTYSDLLDDVEDCIIEMLKEAGASCNIVIGEFSGTV